MLCYALQYCKTKKTYINVIPEIGSRESIAGKGATAFYVNFKIK
jgi:hypothetical protein